jgi:hypothetical protein
MHLMFDHTGLPYLAAITLLPSRGCVDAHDEQLLRGCYAVAVRNFQTSLRYKRVVLT